MKAFAKYITVIAAFSLSVFIGPTAWAQTASVQSDPCVVSGIFTDVRPDNKGPATLVSMGLRVIDVREINDVDQTITVDFAVRLTWKDERLASYAGCRLPIDKIWFPELVLINSGRVFNRWPEQVSVDEGGGVAYMQRMSGTLSSHHQLLQFPFDKQFIDVTLFPLDWTEDSVLLEKNERFEGIFDTLNISDWEIVGVAATVETFTPASFESIRSSYRFTIQAERYVSYYFWKIILPVCLIVVMSWSVFWIKARDFGTQLGLSATSVLTMVAFIFATTNMLPRLGYFTLLDKFIAGATVMVFLALLQSVCTGYIATRGNEIAAQRIDRTSRVAFPLVFLLFCAWCFSIAAQVT